MIWLVMILLIGFLCWQTLMRAYQGQDDGQDGGHPGEEDRWKFLRISTVIALLFIFGLLVLWQIILILKPA